MFKLPQSNFYGSFYDDQDQITTINTATAMIFRQTDFSNDVSITSDGSNLTKISIKNIGKYNIQFSTQLDRVSGGASNDVVDIWLRKNNTDIAWTNTRVNITGASSGAKLVAAWNFFVEVTNYDNDFFQLMWATTDANIYLKTFPANLAQPNPAAYPATPSIILTVCQI